MKRLFALILAFPLLFVACEKNNLSLTTDKKSYDVPAAGGEVEILVTTNASNWTVTLSEDNWTHTISENKLIVSVPRIHNIRISLQ